jgi:hypothetical protein
MSFPWHEAVWATPPATTAWDGLLGGLLVERLLFWWAA